MAYQPGRSLFDYAPGKTTETYNLGGFPAEYLTLNLIPESRLRAARQTCFDEDVEDDFLEGCVFDVAFSGFNGFARAAAQASRMQDALEDFGINLPIDIPEDPDSILEDPRRIIHGQNWGRGLNFLPPSYPQKLSKVVQTTPILSKK